MLALRLLISLSDMNVLDAQATVSVNPSTPLSAADEAPAPSAFGQLLNLFLPPVPAADGAQAAPDRSAAKLTSDLTEAAPAAPAIDLADLNRSPRVALGGNPVPLGELPGARTRTASFRENVDFDSMVRDLNVASGPAMQNGAPLQTLPGAGEAAGLVANDAETEAAENEPRNPAVVGAAPAVPVSPPVNSHPIGSFEYRDTSGLNTTGVPIGAAPFAARTERSTAMPAVELGQPSSGDNRKNDFSMVTAARAEPTATLAIPELADAVAGEMPVKAPIMAQRSPAEAGDGAQAQSLSRDDRPALAANLTSTAAAHQADRQSARAANLSTGEGPREIDIEPTPMTARDGVASSSPTDSRSDRHAVPAPSSADAQDPSREDWQRNSQTNQQSVNPPAIAGTSNQPHGKAVTAPEWRPMVDRLARDIAEHLRVGKQEAVLQLDPPDLGRVKIDLRIEDGQLHVRIAAEGHESQGLIENHLPELQQALRAGQIDVGELRVTQGEWNGGGALTQNFGNQSPQGRQDAPRGFAVAGSRDESTAERQLQTQPRADGRVSMWA